MAAYTSHLGRLGLINPKEPTVKHCTAKFYLIVRGNACLDLRKEDKCANNAVFKKSLEAFAGGVLGTVVFPRSPHEWRVTEAVRYLEVFGKVPPVQSKLHPQDIARVLSDWPCRKSSLRERETPRDSMHAVFKALTHMMGKPSAGPNPDINLAYNPAALGRGSNAGDTLALSWAAPSAGAPTTPNRSSSWSTPSAGAASSTTPSDFAGHAPQRQLSVKLPLTWRSPPQQQHVPDIVTASEPDLSATASALGGVASAGDITSIDSELFDAVQRKKADKADQAPRKIRRRPAQAPRKIRRRPAAAGILDKVGEAPTVEEKRNKKKKKKKKKALAAEPAPPPAKAVPKKKTRKKTKEKRPPPKEEAPAAKKEKKAPGGKKEIKKKTPAAKKKKEIKAAAAEQEEQRPSCGDPVIRPAIPENGEVLKYLEGRIYNDQKSASESTRPQGRRAGTS